MSSPFLLFLIPASPLLALLIDSIKQKHSRLITICLCLLSFVISAPILFTDYNYTGEFSNYVIAGAISVVLNICWMQHVRKMPKLFISFALTILSFFPISLMFFGRAFVGGPEIYSVIRHNGYKVVHKRDGSPGILEPDYFALYKTAMFGTLEKYISRQYARENECQVILKDSTRQRIAFYNSCDKKFQVKNISTK